MLGEESTRFTRACWADAYGGAAGGGLSAPAMPPEPALGLEKRRVAAFVIIGSGAERPEGAGEEDADEPAADEPASETGVTSPKAERRERQPPPPPAEPPVAAGLPPTNREPTATIAIRATAM